MSFAAVRDQDVPLRLFRAMLRRNRIPNALLFWGPAGVGKRLAAHELAKALVCREQAKDACDTCAPCRKVEHGHHPDVREFAPVKKTRLIGVETVDTVNELAVLTPVEAGRRIFILQDAERMTPPIGRAHV